MRTWFKIIYIYKYFLLRFCENFNLFFRSATYVYPETCGKQTKCTILQSINSSGQLPCFQRTLCSGLSTVSVYVCLWGPESCQISSCIINEEHAHRNVLTLTAEQNSVQPLDVPVSETDMASWSEWCIL